VARLFAPGIRSPLYLDMSRTWAGGEIELRPNVALRAYVRADVWGSSEREQLASER
jgi:hypothetical protein